MNITRKVSAKFKNSKKLRQIALFAVLAIVALICAKNPKALALVKQVGEVMGAISGTQANTASNMNDNTTPTGTKKLNSVEEIFGPTAPTNHEGSAEEYRELEMKELWEAVNSRN